MILITGATGHFGGAAVDFILKNSPYKKIAVLIRDEKKAEGLSEKGVELRIGNYLDHSSLVEAFRGIDKLGFVSGSNLENRMLQHTNIIDAAKRAGVKHIYYTSIVKASADTKFFPGLDHFKTEEAIKSSGITYTFLRNTFYMEVLPPSINNALQRGMLAFPTKGAKANYASRIDMAEAFAKTILTDGHENKTYEITSGKAYTYGDITGIVNSILGKQLKYIDISVDDLVDGLKKANTPEPVIKTIVSIADAISAGELDVIDDSLEKLLNRKPIGLEEFLRKT
ncbi:MAG: SDR family oxidoreductase, partial [Ignavibacteriaceae bacterium]